MRQLRKGAREDEFHGMLTDQQMAVRHSDASSQVALSKKLLSKQSW